jgi:Uma2 family endonuclease
VSVSTTLPFGEPLTTAFLETVPDDGHRYELVDGTLIVTPAPSYRHQSVSLRLSVLLDAECPADLRVLTAPFAVTLGADTELQPDLLVASRADFTERDLPTAPLLAAEILSPSTQLIDLNLKKARFEKAGCPSYWVVDPVEPRVTAWELEGATYIRVADIAAGESWTAERPFPVTVTPSDLAR